MILNVVVLEKEIERARRYHNPLSLILLDVDDFKKYNDSYGHVEGDQALEKLGEIIKKNIRSVDTAYRYGGEEFTIILPETGWTEAYFVADRIRRAFEGFTFYPERLHSSVERRHLSMSMGLVEYDPTFTMEDFVRYADNTMYKAKMKGGNRIIVHKIKGSKPEFSEPPETVFNLQTNRGGSPPQARRYCLYRWRCHGRNRKGMAVKKAVIDANVLLALIDEKDKRHPKSYLSLRWVKN